MVYKRVFEIAFCEVEKEHIIVKGRALEDIFQGDVVGFYDSENSSSYIVDKIITYRRSFPMLSSVMTGELELTGEDCDISMQMNYLYGIKYCLKARADFLCECIADQFMISPESIREEIGKITDPDIINNLIRFLYRYETIQELEAALKDRNFR